jgi:hypothetical protein
MLNSLFKNKMNYDIDVESKIIFQKYLGEVAAGNIVQMNNKIVNDPKFDWSYNWIVDVSKGKQLFSNNKLDLFFDFFLKNVHSIKNIKMVIILGSPNQSSSADAWIRLFEKSKINISVRREYDKDVAIQWIQSKN